jgi:3'5'-cyclic nucleotide phosphodiesterase
MTYWCKCSAEAGSVATDTVTDSAEPDAEVAVERVKRQSSSVSGQQCSIERLVDWNIEMFEGLLKDMVSHQAQHGNDVGLTCMDSNNNNVGLHPGVEDLLVLPLEYPTKSRDEVKVSGAVSAQLQEFMVELSGLYHNNPFHSFEHASHTAMSALKMMNRIYNASPDEQNAGIFNPQTKLAIVFAALVHDVDHAGVSNAQLVQERHYLAEMYGFKSVAEQNSLVTTWLLFMNERYADLRACICSNKKELAAFRRILVTVVMATDLFDKDLKNQRDECWDRTFGENVKVSPSEFGVLELSIVAELIIQASDVSHTMQHFTVYRKWNFRLLTEMYDAYQNGRAPEDPTTKWYEGELWFFDNYVIPLAQKLKKCNIFGASCAEFLDYAIDNRAEWEAKGRDIVQEAIEAMQSCRKLATGPSLTEL